MKRVWKILILIVFIILACLIIIRANTVREIDDVTPGISCEKEYLEKSNILWIIPRFENIPISENKKWCSEILALNKTLGMHGIYHSHKEFKNYVNETEIQEAIQIFEDCFNQTPTMFKPPQLIISKKNKKLIENLGFEIRNGFQQTTHKVYHCDNTGTFSNKFHDVL